MALDFFKPVSFRRHGKKYWRRIATYEFAKNLFACPIVAEECFQIAARFPIVFRKTGAETEAVCLLSTRPEGRTPFVSHSGQWLGGYVPSALRSYPFSVQKFGSNSGQAQLLFDERPETLSNNPSDVPFFDSTHDLSAELQELLVFLRARVAAEQDTAKLCKAIAKDELFVPLGRISEVTLPGDFLAIDPKRISHMKTDTLTRYSVLRLIHAHQVSLNHLQWLDLTSQYSRPAEHAAPAQDFLGAIARAQMTETRESSNAV